MTTLHHSLHAAMFNEATNERTYFEWDDESARLVELEDGDAIVAVGMGQGDPWRAPCMLVKVGDTLAVGHLPLKAGEYGIVNELKAYVAAEHDFLQALSDGVYLSHQLWQANEMATHETKEALPVPMYAVMYRGDQAYVGISVNQSCYLPLRPVTPDFLAVDIAREHLEHVVKSEMNLLNKMDACYYAHENVVYSVTRLGPNEYETKPFTGQSLETTQKGGNTVSITQPSLADALAMYEDEASNVVLTEDNGLLHLPTMKRFAGYVAFSDNIYDLKEACLQRAVSHYTRLREAGKISDDAQNVLAEIEANYGTKYEMDEIKDNYIMTLASQLQGGRFELPSGASVQRISKVPLFANGGILLEIKTPAGIPNSDVTHVFVEYQRGSDTYRVATYAKNENIFAETRTAKELRAGQPTLINVAEHEHLYSDQLIETIQSLYEVPVNAPIFRIESANEPEPDDYYAILDERGTLHATTPCDASPKKLHQTIKTMLADTLPEGALILNDELFEKTRLARQEANSGFEYN